MGVTENHPTAASQPWSQDLRQARSKAPARLTGVAQMKRQQDQPRCDDGEPDSLQDTHQVKNLPDDDEYQHPCQNRPGEPSRRPGQRLPSGISSEHAPEQKRPNDQAQEAEYPGDVMHLARERVASRPIFQRDIGWKNTGEKHPESHYANQHSRRRGAFPRTHRQVQANSDRRDSSAEDNEGESLHPAGATICVVADKPLDRVEIALDDVKKDDDYSKEEHPADTDRTQRARRRDGRSLGIAGGHIITPFREGR